MKACLLHTAWLLLATAAAAQNGTVSDHSSQPAEGAVEEAIRPFYEMTNTFLDVVHPRDRQWLLDDPAFNYGNIDIDLVITEWKKNVKNYIGFLACVAAGVLFVLVMPIAGLVLCCCRCCCGNCGANAEDEPEKDNRWARYICAVLLFVFTTFILAGTILTFFTNEYLWEQTAHEDRGVIYDANATLKYINQYKERSKMEFTQLGTEIKAKVDSTVDDVRRLPVSIAEAFDRSINVSTLLNAAKDLQASARRIEADLVTVDTSLTNLQLRGRQLSQQLQGISSRMLVSLQGCPSPASSQCSSLYSKMSSLQQFANFTQIQSVNSYLDELKAIDLSNIYTQGKAEYDKLRQKLDATIKSKTSEISRTGEEIKAGVDDTVVDVRRQVDKVQIGNYSKELKIAQEKVQEYGNYRKYGGIAVGCALLITAVLFYLGLLFGCCGSDPDADTGCNKGTGANLLMGGIVWAFLFSWILMIIVIILFLSGGLVYTEGCRYVVHIGQTPESQRALETLNKLIEKYTSSDEDINITSIVQQCKENRGAYTAFNLHKYVDLDAELNLDKYDLQSKIQEIERLRLTLPAMDILSDADTRQLSQLRDADLQSINFQSFYNQLQYDDFTSENLLSLADEADAVATLIERSGDTTKANKLRQEAVELRNIHSSTVQPMMQERDKLEAAVRSLEQEVKGPSGTKVFSDYVASLLTAFTELQAKIDLTSANDLTQPIQQEAHRIYDNIKLYVEDIKRRIRDEVASCGDLYSRLDDFITVSCCGRVVQSYNAFWFSVGWCLFFFIPCIIVAWILNVQYRRMNDYEPAEKGFEDPYHGHRKPRGGQQNRAYREEGSFYYPGSTPPHPPHYYHNRHY